MTRSKKKPIYLQKILQNYLLKRLQQTSNPLIKHYSRQSTITSMFVGQKVGIHNGKIFQIRQIQPVMIGHKFGEFSLTKKRHIFKSKRLKKK